MGPDWMHPQVLGELADTIARPPVIMVERSWRSGKVSKECKKANVTPVFKNGKEEDPSNYQPVRLMEHLILESISIHMDDTRVISNSQHGLTKDDSCSASLLASDDETNTWMDEGEAIDVFCLNFSKAFNTISHLNSVEIAADECKVLSTMYMQ
ncbi:RNA-directed DNA polymerase from mobile element jockey-like protein [Turdus rufiventris]|nr:RNA-directed DNA polymerase from mobile element jockey-like protein [Turdus rufiventris]